MDDKKLSIDRTNELEHELKLARKRLAEAKGGQNMSNVSNNRELLWKGVQWGFQGFGNIAKSLGTPNSNRRMKIAQMPAKRSDMDIIRNANYSHLKSPSMRDHDIRGRRIK